MTSIGRGRGSIVRRDPDKAPPQLRRPMTDTQAQLQVPLDILLAKIDVLDVNDGFVLKNIRQEIVFFCTSLERMDKFIECLHKRALDDRNFGHRAAVAICTTSSLSVDGHKLRNSLIKRLQYDYTASAALQQTNPARYLNAVAFLGEVFKFVRLASDMPIAVLLMALIDYQNRLINGGPTEIELCVNMLALNNNTLRKQYNDRLESLVFNMWNRCLSESLPAASRAWLLLALHIHATHYEPIDGMFLKLFEQQLSPAVITRVNTLMSLPDTIPLPWLDEAGLDALKPATTPQSPGASVNAVAASMPSALSLETSLPSPKSDGFPSPNGGVSSEVAAVHQARPRQEQRPGSGGEQGSWGGKKEGGGWSKGDAPEKGKAEWGGQNRGGKDREGKWGGQRDEREKGWGREERKERGSWGGGDREEKERGNWGVREGARRPRDDRNDSSTWLSKPTPSEKDIEAWGLRPARGRAYGHDDRFDVNYDESKERSEEKVEENWG